MSNDAPDAAARAVALAPVRPDPATEEAASASRAGAATLAGALVPVAPAPLAAPSSSSASAASPASAVATTASVMSVKEFIAQWRPRLLEVLEEWRSTLPEEAESWPLGAAYVRESSARSLARDMPDTQLRNVLGLMSRHRYLVTPETLFFEVQSATAIATRGEFKRLYDMAMHGGVKAVGVMIGERLFRNVREALEVKRAFRKHGIELLYLGKLEGDQRTPAVWHSETMQDVASEFHARNTSYYVGLAYESTSRLGKPASLLPEAYRAGERGPSVLGRRGGIVSWYLVEPLASVIKEGCRRYLEGDSFADLARWSASTELAGRTPAGRLMNKRWWYKTLTNPRYAGYQMPTQYMGFKPGEESPKRKTGVVASELVKAQTPALWTLDEYLEIVERSRERWRGPKVRPTYRSYLLSSIAYDATCGHRMKVAVSGNDKYSMRCGVMGLDGEHGRGRRADIAAAELDQLISEIRIEDEGLQKQIEEELRALADEERQSQERFVPDPAIGALRQALAALGTHGGDQVRAQLQTQLEAAQRADDERREMLAMPIAEFRSALGHLSRWAEVWQAADTAEKNRLLREVGMKVILGPLPGEEGKGRPFRVRGISVENPAFELALATAVSARIETLGPSDTCQGSNDHIDFTLVGEWRDIAARLPGVSEDAMRLSRVTVGSSPPPIQKPRKEWLSLEDFARRSGRPTEEIEQWVIDGTIARARCHQISGERWVYVHVSELDSPAGRRQPSIAGARELDPETQAEIVRWLRGQLRTWPATLKEKARLAGIATPMAVGWLADGKWTHPRLAVVQQLLGAVAQAQPSDETTRYLALLDAFVEKRRSRPGRIVGGDAVVDRDTQAEILNWLRLELTEWDVPNPEKRRLTGRHHSSLTAIATGRSNPTLKTTVAILRALLASRPSVQAMRYLQLLDAGDSDMHPEVPHAA